MVNCKMQRIPEFTIISVWFIFARYIHLIHQIFNHIDIWNSEFFHFLSYHMNITNFNSLNQSNILIEALFENWFRKLRLLLHIHLGRRVSKSHTFLPWTSSHDRGRGIHLITPSRWLLLALFEGPLPSHMQICILRICLILLIPLGGSLPALALLFYLFKLYQALLSIFGLFMYFLMRRRTWLHKDLFFLLCQLFDMSAHTFGIGITQILSSWD